ncbi:hypothetical protein DL769_010468 [Monosporascus sp. CRB-8-3]|nr:hypothetical protein DL769_010468 [Monosporascus sp. CRB-8-3]
MVRIKERYLLVNILYPSELGTKPDVPDLVVLNQPTTDALTPQALLRAIRAEVANLFGDYGAGAMEGGSLVVKYLSPATSTFILRINRSYYRLVWAALTFMTCVPVRNGKPCTFRVVHVSGTIRKAEEEAVRRARDLCFAVLDGHNGKVEDPLGNLFGATTKRPTRDVTMRDVSADEGEYSDADMGDASDG